MKLQKKINILLVLLVIVLISLISFVGVYKKQKNIMVNVVPNYNFGTNLNGHRKVVFEVDNTDDKSAKTEEKTTDKKDDNKPKKSKEELEKDYDKSLNIIKKRLSYLKVRDYTVSLDKNTGRIEIMLPEEDYTDTIISQLYAKGEFEIRDSATSEVLMTNSDVSKAEVVKAAKADGTKDIVLNIYFNSKGAKKFENITKDYQNQVINTTNMNGTTDAKKASATHKTVDIMIDGNKIYSPSFDTIVDSGILSITMGNSSSEIADFDDHFEGSKSIAAIASNAVLPVKYQAKTNYYIASPINKNNISYVVYVGIIIVLLISLALIIKYRLIGVLGTVISIGYVALLLIVIRYANVELSLEGFFGLIPAFVIGTIFNIFAGSQFKISMINKEKIVARNEVFKKFGISIIPIIIFTVIACLDPLSSLFSLGMVLFWSVVVAIVYYFVITAVIVDSMDKKK